MMIMFTQGGMVSAITALHASNAAVSSGSWRARRTAGITTPPTAAMSASRPRHAGKAGRRENHDQTGPPRTRPKIRSSSSTSRADMPFDSISSPASTKNGTASSTKWSAPAMTCCE